MKSRIIYSMIPVNTNCFFPFFDPEDAAYSRSERIFSRMTFV